MVPLETHRFYYRSKGLVDTIGILAAINFEISKKNKKKQTKKGKKNYEKTTENRSTLAPISGLTKRFSKKKLLSKM